MRAGAAVLVVLLAAGCGAVRRAPLDLAPGQRAVLGRVALEGFEANEGILELVRVDGGFDAAVAVSRAAPEFAVGLPPGWYRATRLRAAKDRASVVNQVVWDLPSLTFEVGAEPAVYIGTLRVTSSFGRRVRISVVDEMESTLRVLRAWYPDLPAAPVRMLATAG